MPRTQKILTLLVPCVMFACGRAPIDRLGGSGGIGEGDGGFESDGPIGDDVGLLDTSFADSGRPDTGIRDSGFRDAGRDAGGRDRPIPDIGDEQCVTEFDCFQRLGPPPDVCPNSPSQWICLGGKCEVTCPMVQCLNDCHCPPELACIAGACQVANRNNECCFNPMCPPGQSCVLPDGTQDVCQGGFDAGPRDTGVRPDAGRDAGVLDAGSDGGIGTMCSTDCDCDFALACLQGQCRPAGRPNLCCQNPMCPAGSRCTNPDGSGGVCGPQTPVGAMCMPGGPECGPIGFCIDESNGFPGGYCTQQCGMGGTPCPPGAICRGAGGGNNFCLDECNTAMDCRAGYNCIQLGINPQRVCWPVPPGSMNPNGAPVGSSCQLDDDCDQGMTCVDQGFPGGYCSVVYCDPMTNPCPGGSQCYAFPGLFSLCLAECPNGGSQSTCRPRYYCLGPTGQPGVCIGN